MGKGTEQPKLGVLSHFGPFWWEIMEKKVQNNQNWAFHIILDHFGGKRLRKVLNDQNWAF